MDRKTALATAPLMLTLLLLVLAAEVACGGRSGRIVVGSKNFTEQLILGEIVAQHLESRLGTAVDRRFNLGGTLVAHTALESGQIDLYPEYTGTALTAVLKQEPSSSSEEVLRRVREAYRKWNIEWLAPLGFNNTFAMVVRSELARSQGIRTLSEAGKRTWTLGMGYEFLNRPDGFAGLQKTYQLSLARSPYTMDLGLLYKALDSGQVDVAAANSTDAQLESDQYTLLEDDKHYFPPYQGAIAARTAILNPAVRQALEELSGSVTDQAMRRLNAEVVLRQRQVADVARTFLAARSQKRY